MTPELPGVLFREALLLASVGGPMFLALLAVGLVLGIIQSATQINDSAVGFLPRAFAGALVIWALGGWMLERLAGFFRHAVQMMGGG